MSLVHTVDDRMIDRFLSRLRKMKGEDHSTYQLYRRNLEKFDEWLADQPLTSEEVSPLDIEDYVLDLKGQDYAKNTIETHVTALNKCYSTAKEKFGQIEAHPVHGIDLDELDVGNQHKNDDQIKYLTEEQKEEMIENIDQGKNYIRDHLIIEMFWQTGLRKGELRHIELDNVNQQQNRIRVYGQKTSEWRTVHYSPSLNRLLSLWIESERPVLHDSEYLFPAYDAEIISEKAIRRIVTDTLGPINEIVGYTQNGSPKYKFSPHSLRHSHAVKALKDGVPIRAVQSQLGHQNIETTMQYLQFTEDDVAESYQRFEA